MLKVIVAMTTYNLVEYIEQALDSVLNQNTQYDYQVVVADDASTDGTCEILKRYQEKYGDKLLVLYSDKNMGSLANSNRIFDKLQCEYFTFIDGDDLWLTKDRIQKQVEFLENHPNYSMCAGNTQYLIDNKPQNLLLKKKQLNKTYSFKDYIKGNMPFFHTSSIMIRNTIFIHGIPECYKLSVGTFEDCALRGEDFRRLIHLEQGPLYAMNELLSYYRIHSKGVWQSSSQLRRELESVIGYNFYIKYFGKNYADAFILKRNIAYISLMLNLNYDYNFSILCNMSNKDIYLFTELLKDINQESIKPRCTGKNIVKKKIKYRFLIFLKVKRLKKLIRQN